MSITAALVIMGVGVIILAAMRVPVAFILLITGMVGIGLIRNWDAALNVMASAPYDASMSYTLVILPLFIAMGVLAKGGGLAVDGFNVAARVLKRLPGGLAVASVAACAIFAAVSGSSVATVVTLGPIAISEMRRHGYDLVVAAGVVGAAGTLGVLIPPSIVLVLYGVITGESIGGLLLAGVIPGILTAVLFAVALIIRATVSPEKFGEGSPQESALGGDGSSSVQSIDVRTHLEQAVRPFNLVKLVILFLVVMGGIYTGLATPTEAAALGALVALIFYAVDVVRNRAGAWMKESASVFSEAVRLTAMTMALLIGGSVFTYALVVARLPQGFATWVGGLEVPGLVVAIILLLGFVILGMFIDGLSILLIAVPIAYPAMMELGYDGIWFGIVVVKTIEIGLITPPFGMNAFVLTGMAKDLTLVQAFKGVMWFLPLEILVIVLLFVFPEIATFLPSIANSS